MTRYTTKGKERKYTAQVKTMKKKNEKEKENNMYRGQARIQHHWISNHKEENQSKKTDQWWLKSQKNFQVKGT